MKRAPTCSIRHAGSWATVAVLAVGLATLTDPKHLRSDPTPSPQDASRSVPPDPEAIKSAALHGSALTLWETLERAERVECLDCISYVEPLLYDRDARVREIAAWWLRRRALGYVEVATRVRGVLQTDFDAAHRRAAAEALGEFLDPGATVVLRAAVENDAEPSVRRAALLAIRRLSSSSASPSVVKALTDEDPLVRRAAVETAMGLPGFADLDALLLRLADSDVVVRAKAAAALGAMRAVSASASLLASANVDPRFEVRMAAVNALGDLGLPTLRADLEEISRRDSASRVRDAATVAARKLATSLITTDVGTTDVGTTDVGTTDVGTTDAGATATAPSLPARTIQPPAP